MVEAALTHPTSFVDIIRSFDSHERGILFQWAAGSPFSISEALRGDLSVALKAPVPENPFVAMDYTLDWLHAALTCFSNPSAWSEPQPIQPKKIVGSQEDVDMLIAWEDPAPHLALIEAKGFTGWTNKQMASKAQRLGAIFSDDVRALVDVHFVLAGPKPSAGLKTDGWPEWMRATGRVHTLDIGDPGPRWGVRRAQPDGVGADGKTNWTQWRPVARFWT
jgi:hypothetical protein